MSKETDYYMKKTKKICPMCVMHTGDIPLEAIKLCSTHEKKEEKNWFSERVITNKKWEEAKKDLYNNVECQIYCEVVPNSLECRKCGMEFQVK